MAINDARLAVTKGKMYENRDETSDGIDGIVPLHGENYQTGGGNIIYAFQYGRFPSEGEILYALCLKGPTLDINSYCNDIDGYNNEGEDYIEGPCRIFNYGLGDLFGTSNEAIGHRIAEVPITFRKLECQGPLRTVAFDDAVPERFIYFTVHPDDYGPANDKKWILDTQHFPRHGSFFCLHSDNFDKFITDDFAARDFAPSAAEACLFLGNATDANTAQIEDVATRSLAYLLNFPSALISTAAERRIKAAYLLFCDRYVTRMVQLQILKFAVQTSRDLTFAVSTEPGPRMRDYLQRRREHLDTVSSRIVYRLDNLPDGVLVPNPFPDPDEATGTIFPVPGIEVTGERLRRHLRESIPPSLTYNRNLHNTLDPEIYNNIFGPRPVYVDGTRTIPAGRVAVWAAQRAARRQRLQDASSVEDSESDDEEPPAEESDDEELDDSVWKRHIAENCPENLEDDGSYIDKISLEPLHESDEVVRVTRMVNDMGYCITKENLDLWMSARRDRNPYEPNVPRGPDHVQLKNEAELHKKKIKPRTVREIIVPKRVEVEEEGMVFRPDNDNPRYVSTGTLFTDAAEE